jgi:DNA-binding transcriptional LysR family regulator
MNPNRIDLNLLKVFEAILQTRSVTIAASNLGLTQSAVSNALNRLRDALGDPLFVRTSEGMMPTPRAEAIANPIREGFGMIRRSLEEQLGFDPRNAERDFRIFMTDVGQMVLLPPLVALVMGDCPHIGIQTVQTPPFRLREAAMESGDVDLAVGYFQDFEGPFHCQGLFIEDFVCMVRAGHPHIQGNLSLKQFLATEQLVYVPSGGGHHYQESLVEKVYQEQGLPRRVAVRLSHFLGLWTIIMASDLLVTIPRRLAKACATMVNVQILETPITLPSFQITQYWHERFHNDPANKWLRGRFAELFSETLPLRSQPAAE